MTTTLTNLGEDLAQILDHDALKILGIDAETKLEVVIDGSGINIRPLSDQNADRLLAVAQRVMEVHDQTFRKLAL